MLTSTLFSLMGVGLIALAMVIIMDIKPEQSVLIAIGLSLTTSTIIGVLIITTMNSLHTLINSRMSELLAETQRASTLQGRASERADIIQQEYEKQLHLEQLSREVREEERQERRERQEPT
jgi:hypothetical protein